MESTYENDQLIEFALPDKKGKLHWFPGVIHGVRRYEDAATNAIIKITYLIDTGEDEHVDKFAHDERGTEIGRRLTKEMDKNKLLFLDDKARNKKLAEIMQADDLPAEGLTIKEVRQPKQIELEAKFIRPR